MAEITQKFFDDRQRYKKLMKQAEQEYEDTKNPALKNDIQVPQLPDGTKDSVELFVWCNR